MTKQVKKSSGQISKFKKLSLNEIILAWVTIGLLALGVCLAFVIGQIGMYIGFAAGAIALVTFGFAIAQMVELKHYGDITDKLTKKKATAIFATFAGLAGAGILICAIFIILLIADVAPRDNITVWSVLGTGAALMVLPAIGYSITSTIAFVKSK